MKSVLWWQVYLTVSIICAICYFPALSGPFLLDDYSNLQGIGFLGGVSDYSAALEYVFGSDGREWRRSLARATFLLNSTQWPVSDAISFKAVNLLLHLLIGFILLIFINTQALSHQSKMVAATAALTAIMWLINPLNVSTVMYVVQRMTQLSALFCLLSLICYLKFRNAERTSHVKWAAACLFFGVLALLSKENSILLLILIPLSEVYKSADGKYCAKPSWLKASLYLAPLLFICLMVLAGIQHSGSGRVFTQLDRVLIEGEILAKYLGYFFGIGFNDLSLFHDDLEWKLYTEGTGYSGLWWFLHAGLIVLAIASRNKYRLFSFGILWFYLAHTIESTFITLELMFEHRNYLPAMGLALATSSLLVEVAAFFTKKKFRALGLGIVALVIGLSLIGLVYRSALWGNKEILYTKWAAEHPNSQRAQNYFNSMFLSYGLTGQAIKNYDELIERFDYDPYMVMRRMLLSCSIGWEPAPIDTNLLITRPFSSGVLHSLEEIIEKADDPCIQVAIGGDVMRFMEKIEDMTLFVHRPNYYAKYLDLMADFYISKREYAKGMQSRITAFETQPTISTALKVVELALIGGRYDLVDEYLLRAEENYKSSFVKQVRLRESIDRLNKIYKDVKEHN